MSTRPLALITGASSGVGAAVARELGTDHDVLLGGRDLAALDAVAAGLGGARPWPVDLTAYDQVAERAAELTRDGRPLDALVHSAGVSPLGRAEELTIGDWRRAFEVNVVAVAELTRLLLPALRAARGHVVLINSGAGLRANPGWGAYAASKFALRAFADALRLEEAPHGLRVTTIYPGRIDTPMQRAVREHESGPYEPEKYLAPESVAQAVRVALSTAPDAHLTELTLRPAGGALG